MVSALRGGVVLAILGCLLVAIPLFFVTPPAATYSIEGEAVSALPEDETAVELESVDSSLRDEVRAAIGPRATVTVGSELPSVPTFVRDDGQVYTLTTYVADPGGDVAVLSLASLGMGLLALAASLVAFVLAGWRRYAPG
jgi:hypothetical protein